MHSTSQGGEEGYNPLSLTEPFSCHRIAAVSPAATLCESGSEQVERENRADPDATVDLRRPYRGTTEITGVTYDPRRYAAQVNEDVRGRDKFLQKYALPLPIAINYDRIGLSRCHSNEFTTRIYRARSIQVIDLSN